MVKPWAFTVHSTKHEVISEEKRPVWNDPTKSCRGRSHFEKPCIGFITSKWTAPIVLLGISCNEFSKGIWIKY